MRAPISAESSRRCKFFDNLGSILACIKDWLTALDNNFNVPDHYLHKARQLRDDLIMTASAPVLLHGDLHHDNILQNNNDWLAIDPKGVIGDLYPSLLKVLEIISEMDYKYGHEISSAQ